MERRPPLAIVGDFHRHIIVLLTLIAFTPIMAVNAFRHSGWERLGWVVAAAAFGFAAWRFGKALARWMDDATWLHEKRKDLE
jgi:hypothetical protein